MDLNLTPEQESFRDELRAWLADNVPEPWQGENQDGDEYWSYLRAWQRTLFDGSWAGVSWPKEYGGIGASPIQTSIFRAEVAKAKTPKSVGAIGETRVGPTIMVLCPSMGKVKIAQVLSHAHS